MDYPVQAGNTSRIDTARAESILNVVNALAPATKGELRTLIAEFYTMWADDIPGRIDFRNELPKIGRSFERLLTAYSYDRGEMADAFCLAIRQELNRIEDVAIERPPAIGAAPHEVAAWFQAAEQARTSAIIELLWGALPAPAAPERNNSPRSRTLYFRHKLTATIRLYQYARECYEKHTPKSFAHRPNLPTYYTTPQTSTIPSQSSTKEFPLATASAVAIDAPAPAANGARVMDALIEALEGHTYFKVPPSEVAALVVANLLDPQTGKVLGNPNLRLYALARALNLHRVATLPAPQLAALIAAPFGIKTGQRFNGEGKVYDKLFEPLKNAVLSMKDAAKARPGKM